MKLLAILLVFTLAVGLFTIEQVSNLQPDIDAYYCSEDLMCEWYELAPNGSWVPKQVKHFMCNAGKYGQKCQTAGCVLITDKLRDAFINGHNERRNMIALGQVDGVFRGKTATRMVSLIWNDELEMMALQNAAQCRVKPDHCRRTLHWKFTGQNLYAVWTYPNLVSAEQVIDMALNEWFSEHTKVTDIDCINSFGSSKCTWNDMKYFTQMIWDDAIAVGCAIVRDASSYFIACDYSFGNISGQPVYKIGAVGSKCARGLSRQYRGLCHESEFSWENPPNAPPVAKWKSSGRKCGRNGNRNTDVFQ